MIKLSMEEMYGGTQHAAVHGRLEDKFSHYCHALSGGHPETAMQSLVRLQVLPISLQQT